MQVKCGMMGSLLPQWMHLFKSCLAISAFYEICWKRKEARPYLAGVNEAGEPSGRDPIFKERQWLSKRQKISASRRSGEPGCICGWSEDAQGAGRAMRAGHSGRAWAARGK